MSAPPSTAACGWLIVEDESLIALLIEDALTEIGLMPLGPATRLAQAFELLGRHTPEGAILDVNLAGELVYPLADALAARDIPFLFLTGYGQSGVRADLAVRPIVQKPFVVGQIQRAVRELRAGRGRS